jgi:hypothetical protein
LAPSIHFSGRFTLCSRRISRCFVHLALAVSIQNSQIEYYHSAQKKNRKNNIDDQENLAASFRKYFLSRAEFPSQHLARRSRCKRKTHGWTERLGEGWPIEATAPVCLMRTFPLLMAAALTLGACATGDYQTIADDPPGDAVAQITAWCQEQELAPEFDVIRSRVNMSVIGSAPAPFMLASMDFPTTAERIEISRWSEIRDDCFQRRMTLMMSTPHPGVPQPLLQQIAEIFEQNGQSQHALMMALARGEMPYGQFVQESTRIAVRMTAALQPMREAEALEQVAMTQAAEQGDTAADGFFDLLGAILQTFGDLADAGAFGGGSHHHHASGWHGGHGNRASAR